MSSFDLRSAALLAETDFLLGLDASPAAATAPEGDRRAALERLRRRHETECPLCGDGRARCAFGEGHPAARLMFVGEAPGDADGRPLSGPAGEKLDEMVRAMGLSPEETYVTNLLKSRPPEPRPPLEPEIAACGPYLEEQVRIVRPEVIVALGGAATDFLLRTRDGLAQRRGVWGELRLATHVPGETLAVAVMPTFHPAYLLRNYTPETRRAVWSDLQQVVDRLGGKIR